MHSTHKAPYHKDCSCRVLSFTEVETVESQICLLALLILHDFTWLLFISNNFKYIYIYTIHQSMMNTVKQGQVHGFSNIFKPQRAFGSARRSRDGVGRPDRHGFGTKDRWREGLGGATKTS